jgi:imidazolonepropionase-like amidohydrolase
MKFGPWILLVSLAILPCALAQENDGSPARAVTVIRAGMLIDGKSATVRHDQVIVIKGNRIDSVSDAAKAQIPAGASVIDLSHATVLPGLVDSHTHIFLQGEDPARGGYDINILKYPLALRAARATVSARRALEQGFTTIRDLETEGAGYGDVGIKEAIDGGYIPGPRMLVVTRAISTTGGYALDGYAPELDMPKAAQIVDGPVESRKLPVNSSITAPIGSRST